MIAECPLSMDRPIIGCREREVTQETDCINFQITDTGEWYWRTWLENAQTKDECLKKVDGRYGCQVEADEFHLSWHNETYCSCRGGYLHYAWEWTDGAVRGDGYHG